MGNRIVSCADDSGGLEYGINDSGTSSQLTRGSGCRCNRFAVRPSDGTDTADAVGRAVDRELTGAKVQCWAERDPPGVSTCGRSPSLPIRLRRSLSLSLCLSPSSSPAHTMTMSSSGWREVDVEPGVVLVLLQSISVGACEAERVKPRVSMRRCSRVRLPADDSAAAEWPLAVLCSARCAASWLTARLLCSRGRRGPPVTARRRGGWGYR